MRASQKFGGGNPIGAMAPFQNAGTGFTTPTNEEWLRTGLAKAAGSYPVAATHPALQIFGSATAPTGLPSATITDLANDGAGNFVAATADTTNVYKSTDGGLTWATLAHNLGFACVSVAYDATNGHWLFAGNDATNIKVSSTTSLGTAATLRYTGSPTTPVANTAWVRSSGGQSIAICNAAGGNTSAYSTNATAWTAVATTTNTAIKMLAKAGSRWLYSLQSSTTCYYSDTGGTAWTSQTLPAAASAGVGGDGLFVIFTASVGYSSATALTGSWTAFALPSTTGGDGISVAPRSIGCYVQSVWRFACGFGVYETSDLSSWSLKRTAFDMSSAGIPAASFDASGRFFVGNYNSTVVAAAGTSLTTATYVGTTKLTTTSGAYSAEGTGVYYVRIK